MAPLFHRKASLDRCGSHASLRHVAIRGCSRFESWLSPFQSWLSPFPGVFRHIYVADLDAIAGQRPDWKSLYEIAESGLQIWLDAGVADTQRLQGLADGHERGVELDAIIVGLESLSSQELLSATLAQWGAMRCIFSFNQLSKMS